MRILTIAFLGYALVGCTELFVSGSNDTVNPVVTQPVEGNQANVPVTVPVQVGPGTIP